MAFSGGDLVEVICNHPTLGAFTFAPYGGEDSTYEFGNGIPDDDDSSIAANGQFIDKLSIQRDKHTFVLAGSAGDGTLESLTALQKSLQLGNWTTTNINGTVYRITGKPVGRLSASGKDSKIEVMLAGTNLKIV